MAVHERRRIFWPSELSTFCTTHVKVFGKVQTNKKVFAKSTPYSSPQNSTTTVMVDKDDFTVWLPILQVCHFTGFIQISKGAKGIGMQSRNLFWTMKNANLLSNEFNIKLVNEPESVSRVSIVKRKVAKKVIKWSVAECKWPKLINA